MPIDSPFGLIARIKDAETATAFMHLAERVLEIHFFDYLAEWANVDANELDWAQPGVASDGTDYLQTPGERIEFAEWLRQRVSEREYASFAPLWFAPYQQKIYLAQQNPDTWKGPRTLRIALGRQQARKLRDCLDRVLATNDFDGREIQILEVD